MLCLLREMVAINSFTANAAGLRAVGRLTAEAFQELGFASEFIPSTNRRHAEHLVLTRPGRSNHCVGLISHLDTVFSPEEEARNSFQWREENNRIYGPGTLDVKGGTVLAHMFLAALRECAPAVFDEPTWVFLLNSAEEAPSADFGVLCRDRLGTNARAALVMEGGGKAGDTHGLVTARKGRATFQIEVLGRSAHAGNLHERGANAVTQLAHTIQQVELLTDYARELTFNIGAVSGGTVMNRVPHHATAQVEMRAFDPETYRSGMQAMLGLQDGIVVRSVEDGHPCRVSIEVMSEIPPWPRNAATKNLFSLWQETARSMGMTVVSQERGGVSDGNHVCLQVPTLDGLGPCGDHAHCSERSDDGSKDQEYVERDSFVPKAVLNTAAVLRLLGWTIRVET